MALFAAGTALNVIGNYQANLRQAQAELQNAAFYKEQAEFTILAKQRATEIAESEYAFRYGQQVSQAAKGGVDVTRGSVAGIFASTVAKKVREIAAIKEKSELDFKLATMRGMQSEEVAGFLSSPTTNLMQAGGTLLTGFAQAKGAR